MNADTAEHEAPDPDQRTRIVKRLMFAAGLVGVLLGLLAFFDYLSTPDEVEAPQFTEPVPVPPRRSPTQPVTPAEPVSEPAVENAAPAVAPEPPVVEAAPSQPPAPVDSAPAATTPPPSEAAPAPTVVPAPMASPAPQAVRPVPATKPAARPAVRPPVEAVPEYTAPPSVPLPPESATQSPSEGGASAATPASRLAVSKPQPAPVAAPAPAKPVAAPVAPVAPVKPPVAPTPAAAPAAAAPPQHRPLPAFLVQAGVFTNTQRAQELHARLLQNGIPATLETRVQVGPFNTQAEAEAAKAKMKAMGIDGIVLPPPLRR